ncbi:Acetamidase, partial [Aduncisulcus paluster]
DDIRDAPLTTVHALSGPFSVEGAQPGDLLIVDILDVGPIPQEDSGPLAGQGWGYTGIFPTVNGGGFLTEQFPDAYKAIWDFSGQTATSRHIPGVSFTGIVHPGLMGTAPSAELLARWNAREGALIATDPNRVPALALPPEPRDAVLGALSGESFETAAAEAARTAPPRENGGNQDIKNLTKGSRMGGFIDLHVDVLKGGMDTYGVAENAIFMPGNTDPQYSQWLAFSGTSVTLDDEQRYLDSHLAYQRACLHAIDYLTKFGYSPEQAYLLLGAAPIEGRLSGVVDIPNSCATVYIPTAIFDFPVTPSASGPVRIDAGPGAPRSVAR